MIGTLVSWTLAKPWALRLARWGAIALAVLLFLLSLRRAGEHVGRAAERLDTLEVNHEIQRRRLEAASRRPRCREELAERLRDGRFRWRCACGMSALGRT